MGPWRRALQDGASHRRRALRGGAGHRCSGERRAHLCSRAPWGGVSRRCFATRPSCRRLLAPWGGASRRRIAEGLWRRAPREGASRRCLAERRTRPCRALRGRAGRRCLAERCARPRAYASGDGASRQRVRVGSLAASWSTGSPVARRLEARASFVAGVRGWNQPSALAASLNLRHCNSCSTGGWHTANAGRSAMDGRQPRPCSRALGRVLVREPRRMQSWAGSLPLQASAPRHGLVAPGVRVRALWPRPVARDERVGSPWAITRSTRRKPNPCDLCTQPLVAAPMIRSSLRRAGVASRRSRWGGVVEEGGEARHLWLGAHEGAETIDTDSICPSRTRGPSCALQSTSSWYGLTEMPTCMCFTILSYNIGRLFIACWQLLDLDALPILMILSNIQVRTLVANSVLVVVANIRMKLYVYIDRSVGVSAHPWPAFRLLITL